MMIPLAIILNLTWYWPYWLLSTNCAIFISSFLPEHHLLQFYTASGAVGEEDHRAWVLLLLHPRQDGPGTQEQGVPRLQGGTLPQPRLLRSFHPRHRYSGACLASIGRYIAPEPLSQSTTCDHDPHQAVNVVINFDFPKMAETYLHRIGRSGRLVIMELKPRMGVFTHISGSATSVWRSTWSPTTTGSLCTGSSRSSAQKSGRYQGWVNQHIMSVVYVMTSKGYWSEFSLGFLMIKYIRSLLLILIQVNNRYTD